MAKMAARWGAGEETLTACNTDFFPMDTLDETVGLSTGETLEALQSCLDPSILSMFEDTPTVETKGLDEENEATLLTALTEILDNVDDENLSPFDTLPDSDLLSGQKGREHSPLRRLLCLPRSHPEKDTQCSERPMLAGKSLPRMQVDSVQRSDGEEEDESSFTLSPVRHDLSPDSDLLDWEGQTLPLPITFNHEGEDGVSVSLGDLVRHMHPYCMAICLESDDKEQILPEGGILLEVVDQGENGEPILAIPDMNLPVPLPLQEPFSASEQREAEEVASDSSEHIVVDDERVTVSDVPVKVVAPATPHGCSDVKDEMTVNRKKEEVKEKSPSRRKRKKKCKEPCQSKPVEGRVLRSGTVRKMAEEAPKKSEQRSFKEKKHNIPKNPPASASVIPKKLNPRQTETQAETTTATLKVPTNVSQDSHLLKASPEVSQPLCSSSAVCCQQPDQTRKRPGPTPVVLEHSSAAPPAVLAPLPTEGTAAASYPQAPQITPPINEALPPVAQEPKPKSLSLAEYRRLRQQKKPAPVEKRDNTTTKWPSLPEPPKELPPIPCFPDPNPKDPQRPNPPTPKKEVEEVRPAWQPRGPAAPPTPEALLVPPAYMTASSSKVSAATPATKLQQTPETSKPALSEKPTAPVSKSVSNLDKRQHITTQPAVPRVPPSAHTPASLKQTVQFTSSADEKHSLVLSGGNGVDKSPQPQPISPNSAQLTESCSKTTTASIKPSTTTRSVPQKAILFKTVPDVTAATTLYTTADCEYSKPTTSGPQCCSSSASQTPESQILKEEPVILETKEDPAALVKPQRARSPTQELIEAFTNEIGIEAADLTSLLEQFEENQAKEEQSLPEVSGRAAAVGNSSLEVAPEKTVLERVRANDLSNTAALTPPATPPHQMWKPLAPMALLGKSRAVEASKLSPSKVIQIEAQPLPSLKSRSKPTPVAAAVDHNLACLDHDYCLPNKGTSIEEPGRRWNVKQQSFITIKSIKQPTTTTTRTNLAVLHSPVMSTSKPVITTKTQVFPLTGGLDHSSLLETPDSSPARQETEYSDKIGSPRRGHFRRAYCRHAASRSPSPRSSPKERRIGGRSRKRRLPHSPSPLSSSSESDSHSSRSRSRSSAPSKKRYHPRHSESSSSSSSRSSSQSSLSGSRSPPRRRRYSYSSSHSASGSRSRSHSRSPQRRAQWSRSSAWYSASCTSDYSHSTSANVEQVKRRKEKAIEERRVVYVGRIRGSMTQKELRERFSLFGEIEECTLHFRDHGDNYGFVTYYDTKDAFTAIENGSKLRKPDELPFDLCFGGRRQFCQSNYADLDSSREFDPLPVKDKFHALDFDTLLRQAQQNLKR